ncbi:MAG: M14 family metallopeptidase, partial [Thermoanaerobaculia bacterium]|nr:M14 family metallopeptidase [Thermoanaerobaculia bacterium]
MRTSMILRAVAVLLFSMSAIADVPTLKEATGSDASERITTHAAMVHYLTTVAAASPRVTIVDQGRSWEERPLVMAIITSPDNHARLEEIRMNAQRLGDPRSLSSEEARQIIENQPAIVWLGGSIHGFELSGAEGLLKLVDHLATRDDPETMEVLSNSVVLIDPMLNPDGRDAFAQTNHGRIGRVPNPSRHDWNNDFTRWEALRFRTGHYYFDTNRDWWAQTQRETQARARTILDWRPQVIIDAHEMGSDVEFFFDPPTDPWGPFYPELARTWYDRFSQAHARAFDLAGFEYLTGESYNYFYPGYTTSWGSYQGAVGMLYEQGSSRGLAITRPDESVRTLADARDQQYTAAWAATRLAATQRRELLNDYRDALQSAIADGTKGVRRYLIDGSRSEVRAREVAGLAERNGIDVRVLDRETRIEDVHDRTGTRIGTRTFPAGTYVIETAQPHNRLIRALFEPETQVPEEFLGEARTRLERGENPRFYDITSWSGPLLFDVAAFGTTDGRQLATSPFDSSAADGVTDLEPAEYAYLLHGDSLPSSTAAAFLRERGHRVGYLFASTRIGDVEIPAGTAVVRIGQSQESVREHVVEAAERYDLTVVPVASGLAEPGLPA